MHKHKPAIELLPMPMRITCNCDWNGFNRPAKECQLIPRHNRQPKTPILRSALVLKFAPLKVVWGFLDTEKKLYKRPFGPEPIAGAKIPERFSGLLLLHYGL